MDGCLELSPGSEEEVELRACTVAAVEQLRQALAAHKSPASRVEPPSAALDAEAREHRSGSEAAAVLPNSVQLDWWLWEQGEAKRASHPPHHRTLTIYY